MYLVPRHWVALHEMVVGSGSIFPVHGMILDAPNISSWSHRNLFSKTERESNDASFAQGYGWRDTCVSSITLDPGDDEKHGIDAA